MQIEKGKRMRYDKDAANKPRIFEKALWGVLRPKLSKKAKKSPYIPKNNHFFADFTKKSQKYFSM